MDDEEMLESLYASHSELDDKELVRMCFGEGNPNLRGVTVVMKRVEAEVEGMRLYLVEFIAPDSESEAYVYRNQERLVEVFKKRIERGDIHIDISREGSDSNS